MLSYFTYLCWFHSYDSPYDSLQADRARLLQGLPPAAFKIKSAFMSSAWAKGLASQLKTAADLGDVDTNNPQAVITAFLEKVVNKGV